MSKYEELNLPRRNGDAVKQALLEMDGIIREQQKRIDGLMATLTTLNSRISALEQLTAVQRAKLFGTGPTVT